MIVGLLSDAHGNVEGFLRGVDLLGRLGAQRIFFLGDAVGYLPGGGVVDAIVDTGVEAIAGNHEAMLLRPDADVDDAVFRYAETSAALGAAGLAVVASWPTRRVLHTAAGPVLLTHDGPRGDRSYLRPDTDLAALGPLPWRVVAVGHSHRAFVARAGRTLFVNVGSCGLPRDDGRLGAVALLWTDTAEVRIVRYDLADCTRRALARVGPVHRLVRASIGRRDEPHATARATVAVGAEHLGGVA